MEQSELRLQKQRWYPRRPEAQRSEGVGVPPGSTGRRAGRGGTWPRPQPIFSPAHSASHVGADAWAGRSGGGSPKARGLFGSAARREEDGREGRGLLWWAEPVARVGAGNWAQGPGLLAAGSRTACLLLAGEL